jgi:hypothetical protein
MAGDVIWPLVDNLNTAGDLATYDSNTDVTTIANHRMYDAYGNQTSETNAVVDCLFGFTGRSSSVLLYSFPRYYQPQPCCLRRRTTTLLSLSDMFKTQHFDDATVFRPSLSTYVILDGLCTAILLGAVVRAVCGGKDLWGLVGITASILIFAHMWVARHQVAVSRLLVSYRTLLGHHTALICDIQGVDFEMGYHKRLWDRLWRADGFYRIVIRRNDANPIVINARLFRWKDLEVLCDLLREYSDRRLPCDGLASFRCGLLHYLLHRG